MPAALVRQAAALRAAPGGGMLAVLDDVALHARVPLLRERTEVAARNYPGHFVLSGAHEDLVAAEEELRARKVVCHRVPVPYAFHSRRMDPGEPLFRSVMAEAELKAPRLPVVSCATGGEVDRVTVDHLWRATRLPIEYAGTLAALERRGPFQYVDLGPSGTLHNFTRNGLPATSRSRSLPLLSPLGDDIRSLAAVRAAVPATRRRAQSELPALPVSKDGVMKVYGFPGQGSQAKGMGKDLFDEFPEQTALADSVLGYSIRELCVEDPRRELKLTRFTQPALYVVSALAWLREQRQNPAPPDYFVGHSLGEYAALFAAGTFDFETGLRLVARRGELMSRADGGRMAAVLKCDLETVERALTEHGLTALDIANHNAPGQFVLAGPTEQITAAKPVFERLGAHYVQLNVSAPFHSRYLRETAEEFGRFLTGFTLRDPAVPVVANVDARPYRPGEVARQLARQIASPVLWTDTIRYLMGKGDFTFVELGPGRVLDKLVTKIRAEAEPLVLEAEPAVAEAGSAVAEAAEPPVVAGEPVAARDGGGPAALGAAAFRERYGLRYAASREPCTAACPAPTSWCGLGKAGRHGLLRHRRAPPRRGREGPGRGARRARRRWALRRQPAAPAHRPRPGVGPGRPLPARGRAHRRGLRLPADHPGPGQVPPQRRAGARQGVEHDMAAAFLAPAPPALVRELVDSGQVREDDAARYADAAGRRPVRGDRFRWYDAVGSLTTLLPAVLRLRDAAAGPGPRVHVGAPAASAVRRRPPPRSSSARISCSPGPSTSARPRRTPARRSRTCSSRWTSTTWPSRPPPRCSNSAYAPRSSSVGCSCRRAPRNSTTCGAATTRSTPSTRRPAGRSRRSSCAARSRPPPRPATPSGGWPTPSGATSTAASSWRAAANPAGPSTT